MLAFAPGLQLKPGQAGPCQFGSLKRKLAISKIHVDHQVSFRRSSGEAYSMCTVVACRKAEHASSAQDEQQHVASWLTDAALLPSVVSVNDNPGPQKTGRTTMASKCFAGTQLQETHLFCFAHYRARWR